MEIKVEELLKPKILLFGRTGSGKSTLANVLINGHLRPPFVFPTSSGVRGKTLSFQREENEDLVVVDTVGFGEGEHGSVADAEARNMLYDFFVKITQESYNYYAYVHKWGKLDELDARLWDFFKRAFEGAETNFVIIFTHCSPKTLEDNLADIKAAFEGCESYIPVDFPASCNKSESSASSRAKRHEMLRVDSLKRLYDCLDRFRVPYLPFVCLRSNLKKGRILLMGTATTARNMVAKLLVDGPVNMTSTIGLDASTMDGIDINGDEKVADFAELEGRRWQVVNVFAFDRENVGAMYGDVDGLFKGKAVSAKSTAAAAMLASKFMTTMQHGHYSNFVYVEEWGIHHSVESRSVLQEITNALGGRLKRSIAVIVNFDGEVQSKVPNRFKEWGATCQIQLPNVNQHLSNMGRDLDAMLRHALDTLEEALLVSNSRPSMDSHFYDTVDLNAFKGLVLAYQELQKKPSFSSVSDSNALQKLKASHLGAEKVEYLRRSYVCTRVLRLPSKHIAAEIPCRFKEATHRYLCVAIVGASKITRQTPQLGYDFIWGELQVVDKHHVGKSFPPLQLVIGNCATKRLSLERDVWYVGDQNLREREFIDSLSSEDTVVLWMNPYPYAEELHEDVLEIVLRFSPLSLQLH